MELSELEKLTLKIRVTKIDQLGMDRLINLANEFSSTTQNRVLESLKSGNTHHALSNLSEVAKTSFCLYCLAIINCYTYLENNRNEIIGQKINKIEDVDNYLSKKNIQHKNIRCYKTMDEFRKVNNAIKHSRINGATTVRTRDGKEYRTHQLKSLYKRTKHLNSYLIDLFEKIEIIKRSSHARGRGH